MAKTAAPKTTKTKAPKEEKPKVPRAKTAYIFFSIAKRPEIVKANPGAKSTEIVKLISEVWNKLSAAEKKPFETQAAEDKKRVEVERASLPKAEKKTKAAAKSEDEDEEEEEKPKKKASKSKKD